MVIKYCTYTEYSFLFTGVGQTLDDDFLSIFQSLDTFVNLFQASTDTLGDRNKNIISFLVSSNQDPAYKLQLETIISKYHITDIIPMIDSEVCYLHDNKLFFEHLGVRLWINRFENPSRYSIKSNVYKLSPNLSPQYSVANSSDDLLRVASELNYPKQKIAVRPNEGVNGSGKGFRVIDASSDFCVNTFISEPSRHMSIERYYQDALIAEKLNQLPPLLLCEYLPGVEYSCYVLADRGNLIACSIHEKQSNLGSTTNSASADHVYSESILSICKTICKEQSLDLLNNIQLKEDSEGLHKLIEINPRIAGTQLLPEYVGCNLLKSCFDLLNGKEPPLSLAPLVPHKIERSIKSNFYSSLYSIPCNLSSKSNDYKIDVSHSDLYGLLLKYDLVIFDLDNTLIDELFYLKSSVLQLLSEIGYPKVDIQPLLLELEVWYKINGNYLIYDAVLEKHIGKNLIQRFLEILRSDSSELSVRYLPNREILLKNLKPSCELYVLTDGNKIQQKRKIALANLDSYICTENIYFAVDSGGKPSPKCAKLFANCDFKSIVMVGDSKVDFDMAQQMNVDFVKVIN
ncbi:ATP-grasp domain-containing protein [Synechococcus sp. UW105]|uniref:ATP-grasp domain-containing protein n=1 Tax=Synechococcus sp. UW105 TaxID=337067 RepID=UPI000E0EB1BB|nr:ATP-grasp domain-containing protein [Synechococcus sp. UW105]